MNTHNIITAATCTGLSLITLLSAPALAQSTATTIPATLSQSVQPSDTPSAEESVPPFYSRTYLFLEKLRAAKQEEAKWREAIAQSPENVEAHLNLAIALRDLARYPEAEAIYQEAIRLDPDREETYTALANLLFVWQSRYEEAIALYEKATEVAPNSARAQADLAEALMSTVANESQMQQVSPAIEAAYRKAVDLSLDSSTENGEYRLMLGYFLALQKRYAEAEEMLRQLLDRQPDNFEAVRVLASVVEESQSKAAGEAVYREAIAQNPDNVEAYLIWARWLEDFEAINRNRAVAAYRDIIRRFPQHDMAYRQLAHTFHWLREDKTAVEVYEAAIAAGVKSASIYRGLGNSLSEIGDREAAEAAYRSAIAASDNPLERRELYDQLGAFFTNYEEPGKNDEAIAAYQQSMAIEHTERTAEILTDLLFEAGRYAEAEVIYREFGISLMNEEKRSKNWQIALRALGREAEAEAVEQDFQAGRLNEYEALYREAIRISPKTAVYHESLADSLSRQGQYQEAEGYYREALRLGGNPFLNTVALGSTLFKQGKTEAAEAAYLEALAMVPEEGTETLSYSELSQLGSLYSRLGELYQGQENFEAALTFYNKALVITPENNPLQERIAEVQSQLN